MKYVRLAVSTPGSVELNQNILLVVHDDLFVVLGHDHGDRAVVRLGNSLALDARLDLSGNKVVDEFADTLSVDLLVRWEGELLVLGDVLDCDSRPLADLEVEVASVLTESLCVDGCESDLALGLRGDVLEFLGERLTFRFFLGEDVEKRNAGLRCQS